MDEKTKRNILCLDREMKIPLELIDFVSVSKNGAFYQINVFDMPEPCYTITADAKLRITADNYMSFEY